MCVTITINKKNFNVEFDLTSMDHGMEVGKQSDIKGTEKQNTQVSCVQLWTQAATAGCCCIVKRS